MSGLAIGLLTLQGVLFVAWAIMMFRALFGIRKRHQAKTGQMFPGPMPALGAYGSYMTDPDYKRERSTILILMVLFITVTAAFATVSAK